jgi:hypothetical protein
MKRSRLPVLPNYVDRYINLVDDSELIEVLEKYGPRYLEKELDNFIRLGDMIYAPGKWTIKDLLQHILDAERVFSYRALRFARNDKTELHGFDEDHYAQNTNVKVRNVHDLLEEFASLRGANILMYKSFDKEALLHEGTASGNKISVAALGFTMCGHVIHHMNVIRERYYPLLK